MSATTYEPLPPRPVQYLVDPHGNANSADLSIVRRAWFSDQRLSFADRGVLAFLATSTESDLEAALFRAGADIDEVLACLSNLERYGYLTEDGVDAVEPLVRRQDQPVHPDSVVYYLRRANGDIKIGYSAQLPVRVATLTRTHGLLDLLGTEPGDWRLEYERHLQFRSSRADGPGQEWFRPAPELLLHIERLAVTA